MKWIDSNKIKLDKPLNDLDTFVLDFCELLNENKYVLISGYVALLFGRSRGTEDVDMLLKNCDFQKWRTIYDKLLKANFWCLNAEGAEETYNYLIDKMAIRFARKEQVIPNMEVKFAFEQNSLDVLNDRLEVETNMGKIYLSSIERQIAYKRIFLASEKDLEDAYFLEEIFKDKLDFLKLNKLTKRFENEKIKEFQKK